jgi:hypothetical protein
LLWPKKFYREVFGEKKLARRVFLWIWEKNHLDGLVKDCGSLEKALIAST